MPRPRMFKGHAYMGFRLEPEEAEAFRKACLSMGKRPSDVLRAFVRSVITGSKEIRFEEPNIVIMAPVNVVSALSLIHI